jgi:hypothetical protein
LFIPGAENALATGSAVSIYNVYTVLGIIVAAVTVASVLSRRFHFFLKDRRAREEKDRRMVEAVIGIPADKYGQGSKGLVTLVSDVAGRVGKLEERVDRLEDGRAGGTGR